MLDCNVVVGNWPFRKIRNNTIEAIEKLHGQYGIKGGFVSSAEAAFYNDPLEADMDLAQALEGKENYRHVITVNPAMPGACANLRRAMKELNPAGVRVYPHYHDFELHSPGFEQVCDLLREYKLPLFLNLRMDDNRAEHMVYSKNIGWWEITGFLQRHTDIPILLCNVRCFEFNALAKAITVQDNVCIDACGLKDGFFAVDKLYDQGMSKYLVYGSNAPVFAMRSSMLLVEKADIPEDEKKRIMSGEKFLSIIDKKCRPIIK